MNDLVGKQVDVSCDQATTATGQIATNQIKAYAVTTARRRAHRGRGPFSRHITQLSPGISPVMRDCVVELVGLEPTTKVLWNMVRVRPTPLVGHPFRSPGVLLFCLIFLAF